MSVLLAVWPLHPGYDLPAATAAAGRDLAGMLQRCGARLHTEPSWTVVERFDSRLWTDAAALLMMRAQARAVRDNDDQGEQLDAWLDTSVLLRESYRGRSGYNCEVVDRVAEQLQFRGPQDIADRYGVGVRKVERLKTAGVRQEASA